MNTPKTIHITNLHPFEGHPYQVRDDAEMDALVESIREHGILTPLIVRPLEDAPNEYEVISGHRRLHAAQKAEISVVLEHHRFISSVLSQAEKELLVPYKAAAKATPPKAERSNPDYYQPDVLDEILDALEDAPLKWKTIVYLLIDTGCRRGEVMGLKWSCVDLDEGILTIKRALLYSPERGIYEGPPKNGHTRCVHIALETQALLKQYREEQMHRKALMGDRWRETGFVFTRDDGRYMDPTAVTGWLAKFSDKQGLPHLHPHAFRHTAASTMIANGVDLVTTADELGHANATTTATIYAHQIATAKAKASSVRSQVFRHRKAKEAGTEPSSRSA